MGASVIPRNIQASCSTIYFFYPFLVIYPSSCIQSSHRSFFTDIHQVVDSTVHPAWLPNTRQMPDFLPMHISSLLYSLSNCNTNEATIRSHKTLSFSDNSCDCLWTYERPYYMYYCPRLVIALSFVSTL